jgi:hypothetical protein
MENDKPNRIAMGNNELDQVLIENDEFDRVPMNIWLGSSDSDWVAMLLTEWQLKTTIFDCVATNSTE